MSETRRQSEPGFGRLLSIRAIVIGGVLLPLVGAALSGEIGDSAGERLLRRRLDGCSGTAGVRSGWRTSRRWVVLTAAMGAGHDQVGCCAGGSHPRSW
jgi:hypothetical protein